ESYTLDGLANGAAGDTLSYAGTTTSVTVNLATGSATGFTSPIAGIENVTGGDGVDSLTGDDGNNRLDGGAGADTMAGGLGDDTYVVDNAGDTVTEASSAGTDTVLASVSYSLNGIADVENLTLTGSANINGVGNGGNNTLGANVENLTLTGSANINGTGNGLTNTIIGNIGDNTLDGCAGSDTMSGGVGNDTCVVDDAGDVIVENASEGTDTVQSSVTYVLSANVENLTLTGSANINATGNGDANSL